MNQRTGRIFPALFFFPGPGSSAGGLKRAIGNPQLGTKSRLCGWAGKRSAYPCRRPATGRDECPPVARHLTPTGFNSRKANQESPNSRPKQGRPARPKLQLRGETDQGRLGRVKPELAQSMNQPGSAWEAAVRAGFDVSQLEANLRKSPGERLSAHRRARHLAQQLRRAMDNRHARH